MQYEPTIEELRHKYEVAMKEKMLVRLEKERLQARTEALEAQVMHFCWTLRPPPCPLRCIRLQIWQGWDETPSLMAC